jgi:hypothetical protein
MQEWNYINLDFIIENDYYAMRDEEGEQEMVDTFTQEQYQE